MDWLVQIPTFANDALPKTILLMIGAGILKKWPAFVNKAIPMTSTALSALITVLAAMFPAPVPAAAPASFMAASFAGAPIYLPAASAAAHAGSWIWNTLVPVGFSIAMHSGAKNTVEWLRMGLQLFWPAGRPPVR